MFPLRLAYPDNKVRAHTFIPEYGRRVAEQRVEAWAALLRTHAAVVTQLEREMAAERNLPLSWYDVLLSLGSTRGLRMQDLADAVVLSRTRVSRVVDDMEAGGLVERRPNPADGRSTIVAVTRQGRAELRSAAPVYLSGIRRHFTDLLTDDELACVRTALSKVVAAHR
jgi:DNA-binding MarR family transcriptional regulator